MLPFLNCCSLAFQFTQGVLPSSLLYRIPNTLAGKGSILVVGPRRFLGIRLPFHSHIQGSCKIKTRFEPLFLLGPHLGGVLGAAWGSLGGLWGPLGAARGGSREVPGGSWGVPGGPEGGLGGLSGGS